MTVGGPPHKPYVQQMDFRFPFVIRHSCSAVTVVIMREFARPADVEAAIAA